MSKVSIIVPCYNVAEWLPRCLESLLGQTLRDIEIICVNDCSDDDTLKILQAHADRDARVRVIDFPENRGVAAARNAGLAAADGEWLGFVDPDDYVDADFFEKLFAATRDADGGDIADIDIVKGDAMEHRLDGKITTFGPTAERVAENKFYFANAWWTAIYRRAPLLREGVTFDEKILHGEDSIFLLHAVCLARSLLTVSGVHYHYCRRMDSLSSPDYLNFHNACDRLVSRQKMVAVLNHCQPAMQDYLLAWQNQFDNLFNIDFKCNTRADFQLKIAEMAVVLYAGCKYKNEARRLNFWVKKLYPWLASEDADGVLRQICRHAETQTTTSELSRETLRRKLLRVLFYEKKIDGGGVKRKFKLFGFGVFSKRKHKNLCVVRVLGIKVKWHADYVIKQWYNWVEEERSEIIEQQAGRIHNNYAQLTKQLRGKSKIRVVFLVEEFSKFTASRHIYENMQRNPRFEPVVLIAPFLGEPERMDAEMRRSQEGLRRLGINFDFACTPPDDSGQDKKHWRIFPLEKFAPDIIFYSQPYWIPKEWDFCKLSRSSLICYASYGAGFSTLGRWDYDINSYRFFWRYFLNVPFLKELLVTKGVREENLFVSGMAKLDEHLSPPKRSVAELWPGRNGKKIIWTPHHTIMPNVNTYGTFLWNYQFMLDFAKTHPDVNFIFMPHPSLRGKLRRNFMNETTLRAYFAAWESLPNARVVEDGDYYDLFKTSDALITDSVSFLLEYLPTTKPILHLISERNAGYGEWGDALTRDYYKIRNVTELRSCIERVVIGGDDFLREARLKALTLVPFDREHGNAAKVARHLIEALS